MASSTNDALAQRANEVQAAKDAVVEAVREIAFEASHRKGHVWGQPCEWYETGVVSIRALRATLASLDALQSEPPEGESAEPELTDPMRCPYCKRERVLQGSVLVCNSCDSDTWSADDTLAAEPELPPRGVAWREMMARVDHEGGC